MHNSFLQKVLTGTIFLLAPAANHAWYKPISYWLHEMAACCYFGVDLGKGLDHNSPSRLTDGTPRSSSDLLYFTLLLPSTWTDYSKSNSLSLVLDKTTLSPNSLPSFLWTKYSKTIPNSVLAAKSF